ncbi:AAA family ATPase [Clostridium botulinum]|uniref:AAA family ATPase n=1 Tax=Clostridium botulinum TaxID=1491 RepID=UPI000B20E57B|nr:AAA family ATPase [Clostridium botulinum]
MAMDYLNMIEETVVVKGLEGKIIMIYGGNNLGKSKQSTKFPKSITLPFEPNALNAIGGAKKLPIHDWVGFKDFTDSMYKDKLTLEKNKRKLEKAESDLSKVKKEDKKDIEEEIENLKNKINTSPYTKFREQVSTIVMDSLTALAKSAEKYTTDAADVTELYEGNRGQLYKRFENEAYHTINKFFNLGDFTYLILAHEDFRNIGTEEEPINQAIPKGDWKRIVKPVVDRCDIIAYLYSNGMDENYKAIPSSAILVECNKCFARTKWDNMATFIKEYSAENLEKAVAEAIREQEQNGVKVGTFEEQQSSYIDTLSVDYEEIKNEIGELVKQIYSYDDEDVEGENMTKYNTIVEEILGVDKKVSDTNEKQVKVLELILSKTKEIVANLK